MFCDSVCMPNIRQFKSVQVWDGTKVSYHRDIIKRNRKYKRGTQKSDHWPTTPELLPNFLKQYHTMSSRANPLSIGDVSVSSGNHACQHIDNGEHRGQLPHPWWSRYQHLGQWLWHTPVIDDPPELNRSRGVIKTAGWFIDSKPSSQLNIWLSWISNV